ncbi:hypothetical protein Tco_0725572 [Tanacetum coccineum]|uniref:Uncharacterized protein n=1 Tax=Tanacetum coccineum TaxID=301880 RepID=A0ABQ4YFF3_9ASTR
MGILYKSMKVQNKLGSNNLVRVLKQESMESMIKNVFGLRWNYRELKGIMKLRFFRFNDDTAVAQRRLKDKQPEEKTNTDCLVQEQEKEYQTGWKIKTGNVLDSCNQRLMRYFLFGRHLDELHVTWAHLEKKQTRLQTNTKTLEDLCSQSLETASQAIYDAVITHPVTTSHISRRPWEAIENFAQCQKEWDNPPNIIYEQEVANLKAQAKRLFGNEDVWVEMHKNIAWDKVENPNPQSTPQVLPLFEEYTPPVTYPEEVKETLGTLIEVEPLDETQLEDLGLNTYNHNIPLSSRKVPSFDKMKPQPLPLPNCPPLDISLGDKRGLEPPIKSHGPNSFRMNEVDHLTNNTPPSLHVASFHPKDTYCNYHPCIGDPKKHYGFKPGLLGLSGSLGVDFSKLGMIEND